MANGVLVTPHARALLGNMINNYEVLVHGRLLDGAISIDGGASVSLSEKTSDDQASDRSADAELQMNAGSGSETVKRPIETCPTSKRCWISLWMAGPKPMNADAPHSENFFSDQTH